MGRKNRGTTHLRQRSLRMYVALFKALTAFTRFYALIPVTEDLRIHLLHSKRNGSVNPLESELRFNPIRERALSHRPILPVRPSRATFLRQHVLPIKRIKSDYARLRLKSQYLLGRLLSGLVHQNRCLLVIEIHFQNILAFLISRNIILFRME